MVIIRCFPSETNLSIQQNTVCVYFLNLCLNKNLLIASMAQLVKAPVLDAFGSNFTA